VSDVKMERITFCFLLLYFFIDSYINVTTASSGQSIINTDSQIHHLQTVLDSVLTDVVALKQENHQLKTRVSFLETELANVKRDSSVMKSKASYTITPEDIKRLEEVLTVEMEQKIRDSERKVTMNVSAAIKDLQFRGRYLSRSELEATKNDITLKSSLEEEQKSTKDALRNLSLSVKMEIAKMNDVFSVLQSTSMYKYLPFCT
jgi:cell division protein FtsB